jgi:hypothetical protein
MAFGWASLFPEKRYQPPVDRQVEEQRLKELAAIAEERHRLDPFSFTPSADPYYGRNEALIPDTMFALPLKLRQVLAGHRYGIRRED